MKARVKILNTLSLVSLLRISQAIDSLYEDIFRQTNLTKPSTSTAKSKVVATINKLLAFTGEKINSTAEYVAECQRHGHDSILVKNDLRWDTKKGIIRLV